MLDLSARNYKRLNIKLKLKLVSVNQMSLVELHFAY